jgi:formylglycine-generating enzyme required for sulfatase activity
MIVATQKIRKPTSLRLAGISVAAVLVGGALILRGPDPTQQRLPEMAPTPITMPDGRMLYVQRHEVTVEEWNACHADGACTLELFARAGFDPATTPATGLSYSDVTEYLHWINADAGNAFRLPTVSEWEHMARSVLPKEPDPIFTDPSLSWASAYLTKGHTPRALKPQGSFSKTPEGIADLDGNVWEWTQDCYAGTSEDVDPARCPAFFVGGEHVAAMSYLVRDPARGGCAVGTPPAHLGMRLVSNHRI